MNVYDFDGTIYKNDSTYDFFFYALRHNLKTWRYIPAIAVSAFKYFIGKINKTDFKSVFYTFIKAYDLDELDKALESFWKKYEWKVQDWYINKKREDDIVISASADFSLDYIKKKLDIEFITTKVDLNTGHLIGLNCHGDEKVRRFREMHKDAIIDEFYSDSNKDIPLAKIAKRAYKVKNGKVSIWL